MENPMDFTSLFVEVLKLSPFVAALLYFLMTVWKSMVKKDEVLMTTMKESGAAMLQMQRENIVAQNNSADALRQLSGSIETMNQQNRDRQDELLHEVREIKGLRANGGRRLPIVADSKTATA